jgi:carboxynorspermidine decarboxylase
MPSDTQQLFTEFWADGDGFREVDYSTIETPCYLVSLKNLEKNLKILDFVEKTAGCKILLALKSFAMFSVFPFMKGYVSGTEASSPNEARLGYEEFGGETHVFSPSYTEKNIGEYLHYADHLVFNSFSQWERLKGTILSSGKNVSCGIRVNVEHSEVEVAMYDPSSPVSRFGVTRANFDPEKLAGLDGIHFHNLCQLGADALERTLRAFEEKFGEFLPQLKWVNWGGGHHITRCDYDVDLLCKLIVDFKKRYPQITVYLEPGEAFGLNAGVLVAEVVDIFTNGIPMAILDVSAANHMPDVLEMPYLPTILDARPACEGGENIYRLSGPGCLTGDVIGDYSFPQPLKVGQKIVFLNMAVYTMVKNNTFNGVDLPAIAVLDDNHQVKIVRKFGYQDFRQRLS